MSIFDNDMTAGITDGVSNGTTEETDTACAAEDCNGSDKHDATTIDTLLDSCRPVNVPTVPLMRDVESFVLPAGMDRTLKGYAAAVAGSPFAGTKPGSVISIADGDGFLDEQATGMVIGVTGKGKRASVIALDPLTGRVATYPTHGAETDVRGTTLPVAVNDALRALRTVLIDASEDWNSAEAGAKALNAAVRAAGNDAAAQRRLRRCTRIIRAVARSPYMQDGPVGSAVRDLVHADGRLTEDEFTKTLTNTPAGYVTMTGGSTVSIAYTTVNGAEAKDDDGMTARAAVSMDGSRGNRASGYAQYRPALTMALTIADTYVPVEDAETAASIIEGPTFTTPTDVTLETDDTINESDTPDGYAHVTRRITISIHDPADINDGTIGRLRDSLDRYLDEVREFAERETVE